MWRDVRAVSVARLPPLGRRLAGCAVLLLGLAGCDRTLVPEDGHAVRSVARPAPPSRNHARASLAGDAMGTTWRLQVASRMSDRDLDVLRRRIAGRLDDLDRAFSNWRPDSEVSLFNAGRTTAPVSVSREVAEVARRALEVARQTGGALDPTLAPLIDLWGFGPKGRRRNLPAADEIERARRRCGWSHLEVTLDPPTLRKRRPDLEINVSAVVEGHALEVLGRLLHDSGLHNWLLEIGGEVLARGRAVDGAPWIVGIQTPDAPAGEVFGDVELMDQCLATSGNYRQFFETERKRVSHLIDPRTGRPVEHGLASVSVMDRSPIVADAYATALMVLGRRDGEVIARRAGLSVVWIESR